MAGKKAEPKIIREYFVLFELFEKVVSAEINRKLFFLQPRVTTDDKTGVDWGGKELD